MDIDQARLHIDASGFLVLNVILGLVMFGVALDLRLEDFRRVVRQPRGPLAGLTAQFVLLPAATWVLSRLVAPSPSIALGMILVASCPGGNLSNFVTHLAGGRTVLSVSMTAVSTLLAIVMTPLNLALWGSVSTDTAAMLHDVAVDPAPMLLVVVGLLGLPIAAGMVFAARAPRLARVVRPAFRRGSILAFVAFVVVAFQHNFDLFELWIGVLFVPVLLHNALALLLGYGAGRALRLPEDEVRAVSIEVGIQNSGLGLVLIVDFFHALGGMALVAAWWGIWHIVAGFSLAWFWARRPVAPTVAP